MLKFRTDYNSHFIPEKIFINHFTGINYLEIGSHGRQMAKSQARMYLIYILYHCKLKGVSEIKAGFEKLDHTDVMHYLRKANDLLDVESRTKKELTEIYNAFTGHKLTADKLPRYYKKVVKF